MLPKQSKLDLQQFAASLASESHPYALLVKQVELACAQPDFFACTRLEICSFVLSKRKAA